MKCEPAITDNGYVDIVFQKEILTCCTEQLKKKEKSYYPRKYAYVAMLFSIKEF